MTTSWTEVHNHPVFYQGVEYRYTYNLHPKGANVHFLFLGTIWKWEPGSETKPDGYLYRNLVPLVPPELQKWFDMWAGDYGGLDFQRFVDKMSK